MDLAWLNHGRNNSLYESSSCNRLNMTLLIYVSTVSAGRQGYTASISSAIIARKVRWDGFVSLSESYYGSATGVMAWHPGDQGLQRGLHSNRRALNGLQLGE